MKPDKSNWKYKPVPVILRYWIFQGMVYMNWIERFYRVGSELIVMGVVFFLLPEFSVAAKWVVVIVISHTLMLFFNGHVIALCVHDLFWFSFYKEKSRFLEYMKEMRARLARKAPSYLEGAYFWGSLTRGNFKPTSDLDIRFIPKKGFWNSFRTAHLVAIERWHALWAGFPLDAYMFRTWEETASKMDVKKEPAVCLYKKNTQAKFGNSVADTFDSFVEKFRKES